jgi:hypothetical protein
MSFENAVLEFFRDALDGLAGAAACIARKKSAGFDVESPIKDTARTRRASCQPNASIANSRRG